MFRPLRIGDTAPDFRARTTLGEKGLSDFRGRWLIFFSHPADFTPVCTTEFIALAKASEDFEQADCALLGLSVDSLYSHLAWVRAIEEQFATKVGFPIWPGYRRLKASSASPSIFRSSKTPAWLLAGPMA
jgi:peroxiredoxin 2/4